MSEFDVSAVDLSKACSMQPMKRKQNSCPTHLPITY